MLSSNHERPTTRAIHLPNSWEWRLRNHPLKMWYACSSSWFSGAIKFFEILTFSESPNLNATCGFPEVWNNNFGGKFWFSKIKYFIACWIDGCGHLNSSSWKHFWLFSLLDESRQHAGDFGFRFQKFWKRGKPRKQVLLIKPHIITKHPYDPWWQIPLRVRVMD